MAADKQIPRSPSRWPWWRCALTALSAVAFSLSAFLAWHFLMRSSVIGCAGGSSCDLVLSSPWSAVRGILPVSGLAMGAYLALLLASLFIGPATPAPDRRLAWGALLILAGAIAGSAVWFTILQKWVIGAFCPYCMATHITGLLLAALVLWRAFTHPRNSSSDAAPITPAPAPPAPQRLIRPLPALGLTLSGLALAGILAACQIALAPPPAYRVGQSQIPLPAIDPHAAPLLGSPNAPYVVALLFDYQCPHCQQVHSLLDAAIRRYDGKLAFVLCPAPLNMQCNPYIPANVDEFKDSCELARIGLAVWVAQPDAFPAFDAWMFSPDPGQPWHARSIAAARAHAAQLVGPSKFDAARADPWIDRYLQTSVRMFGDTINPDQSGSSVPKLVFGTRWVTPEPRDADDLISVLHATLALPLP